ncbi:glutathione peroxidase [Leadbettera azotonutricia]|uniref:Glutathione peroxidase n=1 Tax=Leadbettera azotonutricia (strain ATCC BAA-888 / DSM 13862 / ZAS-9) TaxID=545695 RepID=F5YCS0_LEAAZ|nr:glutathione peroxidase [Leadbettera azotonutricia]AEF80663.1 peroxiredoxin Hyr1 [Leadbettera azotonutricia ZAS-9]
MNLYDFTVADREGKPISLADYKGKVLLIVNTATKCGLTPQYEGLQKLYETHHAKGFEILDFPCNQFGGQAPGSAEEIAEFCTINFHTTFPQFAKIDVNGDKAAPLFVYLKNQAEETEDEGAAALKERLKGFSSFTGAKDIKWNFSKFLVNRDGKVEAWFFPTYNPEKLSSVIERLL